MNEVDCGDEASVVLETSLDAPTEKVWRALAVPEIAAVWLGATPLPGPIPEEPGDTSFEVVSAEPFSRITYRWLATEADRTVESFVTVEIWAEEARSTRFRLTHRAPSLQPVAANTNLALARAA